jgi:hypothetical protein
MNIWKGSDSTVDTSYQCDLPSLARYQWAYDDTAVSVDNSLDSFCFLFPILVVWTSQTFIRSCDFKELALSQNVQNTKAILFGKGIVILKNSVHVSGLFYVLTWLIDYINLLLLFYIFTTMGYNIKRFLRNLPYVHEFFL